MANALIRVTPTQYISRSTFSYKCTVVWQSDSATGARVCDACAWVFIMNYQGEAEVNEFAVRLGADTGARHFLGRIRDPLHTLLQHHRADHIAGKGG